MVVPRLIANMEVESSRGIPKAPFVVRVSFSRL